MTEKKVRIQMSNTEELVENEEEQNEQTLYFLKAEVQQCIMISGIFNLLYSMPLIAIIDDWI